MALTWLGDNCGVRCGVSTSGGLLKGGVGVRGGVCGGGGP